MTTLYTGIITSDNISHVRQRYGTDVVCTPLLEIVAMGDDSALRQAAADINSYDYLLFTSRFAVSHFAIFLPQPLPPYVRIVSIGSTTTAALLQAGFANVSPPSTIPTASSSGSGLSPGAAYSYRAQTLRSASSPTVCDTTDSR